MSQQPNIVVIITDQQRTDTMACYGNGWIQSPHHDALAERSFVFENAYVTQAVCTPARGSLITGLYPHSHGCVVNGIPLREETLSIAEMMPNTYRKGYVGKWHLGDDGNCQHGFDEWCSIADGCGYHQWLLDQGFAPDVPNRFTPQQRAEMPASAQIGAYVGEESERFIRENTGGPWLLVASTFEPHPPYRGPHDGLYDPEEIPLGPTFLKHPEGHSLFNRVRSDFYRNTTDARVVAEDMTRDENWRKLRAQYLGNVKIVDDAIGKMVQALDETGQMENTIFVFTSDHGEMAGDHRMWEKRAFYEESARIPFLMHVPWLSTEQTRVDGVFGHADLVPTLLDLAGLPIPDQCQGESVADALTGDRDLREHMAFMEWNGIGDRNLGNPDINLVATLPWRCVVTGDRWKLNLCAGDQCELFDLNTDPFEENNLFDAPEHRDRIRNMAAAIRLWQHETGDTAPLPSI